jgi:hypothetical protein
MYTASEISPSFHPATRNCATSSGGSVGGVGYQFHIVQQSTFRRGKARFVRLAFDDCFYALLGCSLDPQEVGMAVQSIRTPVQIRNVAEWRQGSRGGELWRNNATTRTAAFFCLAIGARTVFRLLTRLQSVPIVAALQSVGEFSRAFSKTSDER